MFKFEGRVYEVISGKKIDITLKVQKSVERFASKLLRQNQMEDLLIDERIETYLLVELEKVIKSFFARKNIIVSSKWSISGDYSKLTSDETDSSLSDDSLVTPSDKTVDRHSKVHYIYSDTRVLPLTCIDNQPIDIINGPKKIRSG